MRHRLPDDDLLRSKHVGVSLSVLNLTFRLIWGVPLATEPICNICCTHYHDRLLRILKSVIFLKFSDFNEAPTP